MLPSFLAVLAVGLSLSIGWGIRGNFGHEAGAMVPGALSALAIALLSGREDWRRRAPYFALFGALGWAFGGSMSYMQVIAYSHSGQLASQLYGFACLAVLGFLWAALGGAGTAFAATADGTRLREIARPMACVFSLWLALDLALPALERSLGGGDPSARRHQSALYWFDSDWLPALTAVAALLLFDLWDRRFARAGFLALSAAAGALVGLLVERALALTGLLGPLLGLLVRLEGPAGSAPGELFMNWPEVFRTLGGHLGWILGLVGGIAFHFARHGAFRSGSSLLLHLALGWWAGFLLFPVLLGIRMTPPRDDDWAGVLGVLSGAVLYCLRNGLRPVAEAALLSGLAGGLAFPTATFLKLLLVAPGNPALAQDPSAIQVWAHWQGTNWHSFLEQTYGLLNGVGIALVLGRLARRERPPREDAAPHPWTDAFAAGFVLIGITYLNLVKNVDHWIKARAVPAAMKAPLAGKIEISSLAWFHLAFATLGVALLVLFVLHRRRPLAIVPTSSLGKGQLLYVVFLSLMVAGNFERALVSFSEARLLTEGVILLNSALAALLVLALPRADGAGIAPQEAAPAAPAGRLLLLGMAALLLAVILETGAVRLLHGDRHAGHSGKQFRFGPDALWRVQPLRRSQEHP